jgi:hypothetical protein
MVQPPHLHRSVRINAGNRACAPDGGHTALLKRGRRQSEGRPSGGEPHPEEGRVLVWNAREIECAYEAGRVRVPSTVFLLDSHRSGPFPLVSAACCTPNACAVVHMYILLLQVTWSHCRRNQSSALAAGAAARPSACLRTCQLCHYWQPTLCMQAGQLSKPRLHRVIWRRRRPALCRSEQREPQERHTDDCGATPPRPCSC